MGWVLVGSDRDCVGAVWAVLGAVVGVLPLLNDIGNQVGDVVGFFVKDVSPSRVLNVRTVVGEVLFSDRFGISFELLVRD